MLFENYSLNLKILLPYPKIYTKTKHFLSNFKYVFRYIVLYFDIQMVHRLPFSL